MEFFSWGHLILKRDLFFINWQLIKNNHVIMGNVIFLLNFTVTLLDLFLTIFLKKKTVFLHHLNLLETFFFLLNSAI